MHTHLLDGILVLASSAGLALGQGLFINPTPIAELNAGGDVLTPAVSWDETIIVFASSRAGGQGGLDLWFSTRGSHDVPWSAPQPLTNQNSSSDDFGPHLNADGTVLHFSSRRSGGPGPTNILFSRRMNPNLPFPWFPLPSFLGLPVNAPGIDSQDPHVTHDSRTMFFAATGAGGFDLYTVTRPGPGQPWGNKQPFTSANSTSAENGPNAFGKGDIVVFGSNRPGGLGSDDLYLTWKTGNGSYAAPVPMTDTNTAQRERGSSTGGKTGRFYYASAGIVVIACKPRNNLVAGTDPGGSASLEHQPSAPPYTEVTDTAEQGIGTTIDTTTYDWNSPLPPQVGVMLMAAATLPAGPGVPVPGFLGGLVLDPITLLFVGVYTFGANGIATLSLPVPNDPLLVGASVYFQGATVDLNSLGGNFTHPARTTFRL